MLFVIFSILLFMEVNAQEDNQQSLDSFSAKFITTIRTQEKQRAYLVTDKSVYTAGEYTWFRAFLLNAVTQRASNKSRFLFADLDSDVSTEMMLVPETRSSTMKDIFIATCPLLPGTSDL